MRALLSANDPRIARFTTAVTDSIRWLGHVVPVGLGGTAWDGPGDGEPPSELAVPETDAQASARDVLTAPPDGQWQLTEGVVHSADDCYEFRFVLTDTDWAGRAVVCIDGSTGRVRRTMQEVYPEESPAK